VIIDDLVWPKGGAFRPPFGKKYAWK
jgi:hypothetical protein